MFKTCLLFLLASVAQAAPLQIWIDPGHGGRDDGAVQGEVRESDITLAVSRKLHALLKADKRFEPRLTRDEDVFVALPDRARMANPVTTDLFVSIHVNSSPDKRARGAEFYFQNQLAADEESMFLAHKENLSAQDEGYQPKPYDFLAKNSYPNDVAAIVTDLLDGQRVLQSSELSRSLKISWRGHKKSRTNSIRQAPFFVLSQMRVPSTLVELGFLTNKDDYSELINEKSQDKMAQDLYRGLVAYSESLSSKARP